MLTQLLTEDLPQYQGSQQRMLSPQVNALSTILGEPDWVLAKQQLPEPEGWMKVRELLSRVPGTRRLETLLGHGKKWLSQEAGAPVGAMGRGRTCLVPCSLLLQHPIATLPLHSLLFKPCQLNCPTWPGSTPTGNHQLHLCATAATQCCSMNLCCLPHSPCWSHSPNSRRHQAGR